MSAEAVQETVRTAAAPQLPDIAERAPTASPLVAEPLSALIYWHLLSLDAPSVAVTWTWFVGWCCGVAVPLPTLAAMFLAVWMLYVADRLLDARPLFALAFAPGLEARHRFHDQHRYRFLGISLAAVVPLLFLLSRAYTPALQLFLLLAACFVLWFLLIHARRRSLGTSHRMPKELAVGLFFPAATFIPTVARHPWQRLTLLPMALAFAAVCTLNCLYLFRWEHPRHTGPVHPTTRWGLAHLAALARVSVFFCALLCGHALVAEPQHTAGVAQGRTGWGYLACALSALLLILLDRQRRGMSRLLLRSLADFVLLTPWAISGAVTCIVWLSLHLPR